MSNKAVNLELPGSRRAASRSLAPFRSNIRGSSVNHSHVPNTHLSNSISNLAKPTIKQLTVPIP